MSTKLHNGYRMAGIGPDPSLTTLLQRLWCAEQPVDEATEHVALTDAVERAIYARDRCTVGLDSDAEPHDPRERSLWISVLEGLQYIRQESQIEHHSQGHGVADCRCRIAIFPAPDGGDALAMLFCEDRRIADAARAALGLSPLPYWDNTDPPQDCSHEQWRERGALWHQALSSAPSSPRVPAGNAVTFDLTAIDRIWPTRDKIEAAVPDYNRRLLWLAQDTFISEGVAGLFDDPADRAELQAAQRAIIHREREMHTLEGAKRVGEIGEHYRQTLPQINYHF